MIRNSMLLMFVAAAAGCNSTPTPPPQPKETSALECYKGWHLQQATTKCESACWEPKKPECQQADCLERNVVGFMPDGTEVEAHISYSATAGTMSTTAAIVRRPVTVSEKAIAYPNSRSLPASCVGGELKIYYDQYQHASTGWTAAFDGQITSGATSWQGVTVKP